MSNHEAQTDPAGGASALTGWLGGMTPAAWMYKNAITDNWYLRWEEAKDRRSVPLYTPEQIAEIVAIEHRHQKLLEENCRILRKEISELESSPMSEEALDILRSENDRLKQHLRSACDRIADLCCAIEAMRVAGGSVEFQTAFDRAKTLIVTPNVLGNRLAAPDAAKEGEIE